jgi:hypothetical protein
MNIKMDTDMDMGTDMDIDKNMDIDTENAQGHENSDRRSPIIFSPKPVLGYRCRILVKGLVPHIT